MLNIKISISDDNGKTAEVEITEADDLTKLVIIQNVFNLFGANVDLIDMAKTYSEIGKIYSNFFNKVETIEQMLPTIQGDANLKREEIESSYKEFSETEKTLSNQEELSYLETGIKNFPDGKKGYKTRYQCPQCKHFGTHYIYESSKTTYCHNCNNTMIVKQSTRSRLERDDNGFFFYAGLLGNNY